jgi:Protein of unknown function (DUF2384)
MAALTYPDTRYEPSPLVDLNARTERERLSASGLKAFFNIMERWRVRDEDARALLGGISNGPYYELKRAASGKVLDVDRLLRVSYLIGIFKALHILHSRALADQWVSLPNVNRLFGGETPLTFMVRGGVPALQIVRRLLDARRGGV